MIRNEKNICGDKIKILFLNNGPYSGDFFFKNGKFLNWITVCITVKMPSGGPHMQHIVPTSEVTGENDKHMFNVKYLFI